MKISQVQLSPMQIQKKLHKMEFTYNPFRNDRAIKPEALSSDLHIFGQQCNKTEQLKTLFNQTFMHIAETMEDAKQDNLAGIIYGYLSKVNSNNPELLKIIGQKALDIAVKQKDYVHIASRANSLAKVFKYTDKEQYLKFLTMKRDALKEICTHYETSGNQFRTVSRLYNTKDVYALTLIRAEIEIINQKMKSSPDKVREELLALYKKISVPDEVYRVRDADKLLELSKLKGYIQMLMSDTLFTARTGDCRTDFSKTAKNVLDAVKNKTPIQNQVFNDYFSYLYDGFKENSLEDIFIKKSFAFIEDLEKAGEHIITSKLYTVLFNKNVDNPENTKIIARHGLKQRINAKDDYGIVFFGKKLSNTLNANPPYSLSEYLDTVHATMVACKNIINNYDELAKTTKLKPKNDYIRQLIFGKVNSAYVLRSRNPEFFKEVMKEVKTLFKSLPQDYLEQNPNLLKLQKSISEEM